MTKSLFVILAFVAWAGLAAEFKTMPTVVSTTATGENFRLDATSIKKPTLIVFWATWCESCRYEVPMLIKLQKEHGEDVSIVAVNLDDDFETAKTYIKKHDINYVNLKDERGKIADSFGIVQTPTFYVVDLKGKIEKESSRLDVVMPLLLALVPKKTESVKQSVTRDAVVMGTEFSALALSNSKEKANKAVDAALAEIKRIEDLMTDWRDSELMQVNNAAGTKPVKVAAELIVLLEQSKKASSLTKGVFDITYAPLGALWDYNKPHPILPSAEQIKKTLALVNYRNLEIDAKAQTAFLKQKGMRVGLGGIAKGYAVERAAQIMKEHGIEDFAVRAGGDMYVHGTNNGKLWNVVIRNPRDKNDNLALIPISNGAVATSGDYERFFMHKGKRYAHIIDPRTGYPAEKCQSVTIIAKRSLLAEVLSKTVFILGPKEGMEFIENTDDVEGVIVDAKGNVLVSSGLKG